MKKCFLLSALLICCIAGARAQIIHGSLLSVELHQLRTGWKGFAEVGGGITNEGATYNINGIYGYQFNQMLYLGGGIGIQGLKGAVAMPIFIDSRFYFRSSTPLHWYAGLRAGGNISVEKSQTNGEGSRYRKLSGFFFSVGPGCEYDRLSLSINLLHLNVLDTGDDLSTFGAVLRVGWNF